MHTARSRTSDVMPLPLSITLILESLISTHIVIFSMPILASKLFATSSPIASAGFWLVAPIVSISLGEG